MNATTKAQEKIDAIEALIAWRAKSGLSVEEVARRLGVVDTTVYNWINRYSLPTGKGLKALKRLVRS